MYRAEVIGNRLLMDKWNQKLYEIHRKRVCNPQQFFPKICPSAKSVIRRNKDSLKKLELMNKINRENGALFAKLMAYNRRTSSELSKYDSNRSMPINNRKYEKSEMMRINKENVRLLRTLENKQSHYNIRDWRKDEYIRKGYVKLGCIHPLNLGICRRKNNSFHTRRNRKTYNTIQNIMEKKCEPRNRNDISSHIKILLYENCYWKNSDDNDIYKMQIYTLGKSVLVIANDKDNEHSYGKIIDEDYSMLYNKHSVCSLW